MRILTCHRLLLPTRLSATAHSRITATLPLLHLLRRSISTHPHTQTATTPTKTSNITRHIRAEDPPAVPNPAEKGNFSCNLCIRSFELRSDVERHIKTHYPPASHPQYDTLKTLYTVGKKEPQRRKMVHKPVPSAKPINPALWCKTCERDFNSAAGLRAHKMSKTHQLVIEQRTKRGMEPDPEGVTDEATMQEQILREVMMRNGMIVRDGRLETLEREYGELGKGIAKLTSKEVKQNDEEAGGVSIERWEEEGEGEETVVKGAGEGLDVKVRFETGDEEHHLSIDERAMEARRATTSRPMEDVSEVLEEAEVQEITIPPVTQRTYETQGLGSWVPDSPFKLGGVPRGSFGRGIYPDDEAQPQLEELKTIFVKPPKTMEEIFKDEELYQKTVDRYQGTAEGLVESYAKVMQSRARSGDSPISAEPPQPAAAEKDIYCKDCCQRFDTIAMLTSHRMTPGHIAKRRQPKVIAKRHPHVCVPCDMRFKNALLLVQHKLRAKCTPVVPGPGEFERYCLTCDLLAETDKEWASHLVSSGHKRKVKETENKTADAKKLLDLHDAAEAAKAAEKEAKATAAAAANNPAVIDWKILTPAEQDTAFEALRGLVHPLETLKKHTYHLTYPTPEELAGLRVCKNCGLSHALILRRHRTQCMFHPRRKLSAQKVYPCCGEARPCTTHPEHELHPISRDALDRVNSYRTTPSAPLPTHRRAVAIDCEMGRARAGGNELIQLAAVDMLTGETLINTCVRPSRMIADYQTRYSGVTRQMVEAAIQNKTALNGYVGAREELWKFVGPETVLVGHALKNDVDALHLIHPHIVSNEIALDAGQVGLATLAREFCGIEVQKKTRKGHVCLEDTMATREVALWMVMNSDKSEKWAHDRRKEVEIQKEASREKAAKLRWQGTMESLEAERAKQARCEDGEGERESVLGGDGVGDVSVMA